MAGVLMCVVDVNDETAFFFFDQIKDVPKIASLLDSKCHYHSDGIYHIAIPLSRSLSLSLPSSNTPTLPSQLRILPF